MDVPFHNLTALNEEIAPPWASSPLTRGTADILWSCLVTLTACIYTAIHLNVPPAHTSKWRRLWNKVQWAALALIGPELVLYTAFLQYCAARTLCQQLNELRNAKQANDEEQGSSVPAFGLSYGFWVIMGGFAAKTSSIHNTLPCVTLTPEAVLIAARQGRFLELPNEQIADRSKADVPAKFLVCAQVTWMLIQCIGRKAAGYPVSLLEIHTMVHVVCALLIYLLWWHKPFDVLEPIQVEIEAESLAPMMMLSRCAWPHLGNRELNVLRRYDPELASENNINEAPFSHHSPTINFASTRPLNSIDMTSMFRGTASPTKPKVVNHFDHGDSTVLASGRFQNADAIVTLRTGQSLPCGIGPDRDGHAYEFHLTEKDIKRWELTARKLDSLNLDVLNYTGRSKSNLSRRDWGPVLNPYINSVTTHAANRYVQVYHSIISLLAPVIVSGLGKFVGVGLPLIYGGIHLTAWNAVFPSATEELLWKTSCLGIIATIPATWALNPIIWLVDNVLPQCFGVTSGPVLACVSVFYMLCRIFIVVESFISLRHVAIGVYAAVPWIQSLPHV